MTMQLTFVVDLGQHDLSDVQAEQVVTLGHGLGASGAGLASIAAASSPPSATAMPDTLASPPSIEPSPGFECSANRPSRSRSSAFTARHIDPIASTPSWRITSVPLTRGAPSRRSVAMHVVLGRVEPRAHRRSERWLESLEGRPSRHTPA